MVLECSTNYRSAAKTSFQGKFIGERNINRAVKLSQKRYMHECSWKGECINSSKVNEYAEKGKNVIKKLKELASKLPKEFDLILDREKNLEGYKTYCLNIRHKILGKHEVFWNKIEWCHEANVQRGIYAGQDFNAIEKTTKNIESLDPETMVKNYLKIFGYRFINSIEDGTSKNISKKLKVLKNLSEGSLKSKEALSIADSIDYKLEEISKIKAVRRENSKFMVRKFFGLE